MVLDLETCRDDNIDFDEPVVLEKKGTDLFCWEWRFWISNSLYTEDR